MMLFHGGTDILGSGVNASGVTVTKEIPINRTLLHTVVVYAVGTVAGTVPTITGTWREGYYLEDGSKAYTATMTFAGAGTALVDSEVWSDVLWLYPCDFIEVTVVFSAVDTTDYAVGLWVGGL